MIFITKGMLMGWFRRSSTTTQQTGTTGARFGWLRGRKRLAEAPYLLPSDFVEGNRLDMQHYLLKLAYSGNYIAPLQSPQSIVDIGCGTGRWAREMALQFPQANVVGIDIKEPEADVAARQVADLGRLPDNYVFVQGNVLQGLPFQDATFDYTHMRFLSLALPRGGWPPLVNEMARVTQRDGWIEILEFNIPTGGGPAFEQIQVYWRALADKFGMHPGAGSAVKGYLDGAGLRNVQERIVRLDTADRSRTARMAAVDLYTGLASSGPAMIAAGIVPKDEFDRLYAQVRDDITRYNTIWELHAVCGQRA